MANTNTPGNFEQPGAYIDRALNERANVIDLAVGLMLRTPRPIPDRFSKLCRDVTDYAVLECADTPNTAENTAAHMVGLQWAYALADSSSLVKPVHLAIGKLGEKGDRFARLAAFSAGVEEYSLFSNKACLVAEECRWLADPLNQYPGLTRRGILSGLYMADLGMRQRRDMRIRQKQGKRRRKEEEQLQGILAATERDELNTRFQAFRQLMVASGFDDPEL